MMILPAPTQRVCIVTGPQRSGTTIAARMLAHDWGWQFIPEERFRAHGESVFKRLVSSVEQAVIQAPGMAHIVASVATGDVLVVWMLRRLRAVLRSQERIDWTARWSRLERAKYPDAPETWPVALVKYRHWRRVRERVPAWVQLSYRRLREHPLYVPAEKRRDFGERQTSLEAAPC